MCRCPTDSVLIEIRSNLELTQLTTLLKMEALCGTRLLRPTNRWARSHSRRRTASAKNDEFSGKIGCLWMLGEVWPLTGRLEVSTDYGRECIHTARRPETGSTFPSQKTFEVLMRFHRIGRAFDAHCGSDYLGCFQHLL